MNVPENSLVCLVLLAFTLVVAVPVTRNKAGDPVQQLEELKVKLEFLERTLKDLNKNIDTYVEAEKWTHDGTKASGKRHYMTLRSESAALPEQNDVLKQYVQGLSEEDRKLLSHMKNKAQYLQGVLMEPQTGPNPGEELVFDVKRSEIPSHVDEDLQKFESELSPEDLVLLKKLKDKVQYLEGVLHEGPQAANPGEEAGLDKRSNLPSEEEDAKLQEFESQLSPEEIQLLLHMKSKVKFLQGALNEEQTGPNPGETDEVVFTAKRSEVSDTASSDTQLQEFESQLSPEDKVLLKKFGSKVKFLQGALHEGAQSPNPGESIAQEKRSEIAAAEGDQDLQDFVNHLSPEDQALLKKVKAKLPLLQGAIHEGPQPTNPGEETGNGKRSTDISDEALQDFIANLSTEDLALIKHHQEKLNFLKGALNEPTGQVNPGEETIQEKRASPVTFGQSLLPKQEPNQKPVKAVNQVKPPKQLEDNQHPPSPAKPANQRSPKQDGIEFTEADRVLLKSVATKLEDLKKSLEAFKQTYDSPVVPAAPVQAQYVPQQALQQIPIMYGQAPAQVPLDQTAGLLQALNQQAPVVQQPVLQQGPVTQAETKRTPVTKQATKEKRYAAPVTNGRFGGFVGRRVTRQFDEGWHETPFEENALGIDKRCLDEDCECPAGGPCNCDNCNKAKKSLGETLDVKQLLRALSHVKESTRKRRLVDNEEMELDNLKS